MNEYEQRQEAKRKRYRELAEKNDKKALGHWDAATTMSRMIPMGQPILVGHHSEGRHRRDLARIDKHHEKGSEALAKARHYRGKAAGVGKAGISSDDPDSVEKLKSKLATMEREHEEMKAINAAWRKAKKPQPDDIGGWQRIADILGRTLEDVQSVRLYMAGDFLTRAPYTYELTNNSGNMRRVRERIADLQESSDAEHIEHEHDGLTVIENPDENRVQLIFPNKPDEDTRAIIKNHGFRWSRSNMAWQRHLNNAGRYAAQCVVDELNTR